MADSNISDPSTSELTIQPALVPSTLDSDYPKGFKFILPKAFKGDQQELEPWLFNLEQYFNNTDLSNDK